MGVSRPVIGQYSGGDRLDHRRLVDLVRESDSDATPTPPDVETDTTFAILLLFNAGKTNTMIKHLLTLFHLSPTYMLGAGGGGRQFKSIKKLLSNIPFNTWSCNHSMIPYMFLEVTAPRGALSIYIGYVPHERPPFSALYSAPEHIIFTNYDKNILLRSITILHFCRSFTFKPIIAAHSRLTAASPNAKQSGSRHSAPGLAAGQSASQTRPTKSVPETPTFMLKLAPEPPIFSSPEPKAQVSYCRPFSSVVRKLFTFSSSSWKRMVEF